MFRCGTHKEEIATPVNHDHTSEVSDPMEIALRRQPIDYEAARGDYCSWNKHSKSHLGFADAAITFCEVRSESVTGESEGYRQPVPDDVSYSD